MRVALVGPYPVDTSQFDGGVETSFFGLLEGLKSFDDLELHVVTFVPGAKEVRRNGDGRVAVTYFPSPVRLNNLILYRPQRRVLREVIGALRPDIVHAQDAISYGYMTLRSVRDVPVVLSVHGIVREEIKYMESRLDRVRTWLTGPPIQRYCVRRARYLLEPSSYPERYFGDLISGRVFEVGNPIGDRFFEAETAPEPGTVLYAGGVIPGKRVVELVEMLASVRTQVPEARLRIAGNTSDANYVAAVRARALGLGIADSVTLLGTLSPAEIVEEYRRASVFVLASAQENSPMVIAEAMAVGVPVVATRVGGVDSLVDHGKTGFLVNVGDAADLARRVSALLLDRDECAALAAAARELARRQFRSRQVAERVRDAYEQVLADHSPPRSARG